MCDHDDGPLSFARLVTLLREPPFEPCESELAHLTRAEYDAAFQAAVWPHRRRIVGFIARITGDYDGARDLAQ